MRTALLLALTFAILCTSCAASSTITAQAELPPTVAAPPAPVPSAPVQLENLGKKVKFRGPVTLQIGAGNNVTAPPAPSPPPQKERGVGVPWQLIAGALVAGALVCTWLGAKLASKLRWLPFLGLLFHLLTTSPAQAQRQLVIPSSKHSWREAKAAQRRYNRVKRYHQRQNRRDNRELAADHRRQRRLLKGLAAKAQTHGK